MRFKMQDVHWGACIFLKQCFNFFLALYPEVEFLDHIFYFQFFEELLFYCSQWLHRFTFPSTVCKGSLYSTFSPHLLFASFFMLAILTGMKSYLIVALIYIFLIISNIKHLCKCLLTICMSEKMPVQVFCPFFDWVVFMILGCISCLYILEH